MAIRIEVLTEFPAQTEWAEAWTALMEHAGNDEVFCAYEWMKACAEFDREGQPLILTGYDQERLIGLAPFTRRRIRRGVVTSRVIEFLALPWADYCDVIAAPETRAEFIEQCLAYLQHEAEPWDELRLGNLAEGSLTANLFSELARARGWHAQTQTTNIGPVLDLAHTDNAALDELLEKKGVARKAKTLARKGKLEFKIAREQTEVQLLLQDFYRFHTVRYLIAGEPSIFDPKSSASLCRLFELLTTNLSPLGKVCVPALLLDDQPIALYVGFEHRDCLTLYAATFDAGIIGTSPGEILAWEVARYCRAAGIKKLDFGIGDESYKFRFTNTLRRNCELVIHRGTLQSHASSACAQARVFAKQHPALWSTLRQTKHLCRTARLEMQRAGIKRAAFSFLAEGWHQLQQPVKTHPHLALTFSPSHQERKLISDTTPLSSLRVPEVKLREWRARDFVSIVLAYRHTLPSWHFKRALAYLRQGRRGYLVLENERLTQIVWLNEIDSEASVPLQPSALDPATHEIWSVKNYAPGRSAPQHQTDSLPRDPTVSEEQAT